jgi:hypothetical protein
LNGVHGGLTGEHALPSEIGEIHQYRADTILDCPEPPEVRA